MFPKRMSVVVLSATILASVYCVMNIRADFHEDFEGPSINLSNWTIMDFGGLDAVQANGRLYVNGTYDPGETVPNTGGWNHYRLIYKDNFTGFLDISATNSISIMTGTEIAVGIGLMLDNTVGWDNITSWAQYWYSSTNAIGWMNSWEGGVNTELIYDDTDITQFTQHTHRMIHHENNTVQFLLDGVTKGWHTITIPSFYPTIEVGIHAGVTHLEAVFDSFRIITGPPTSVINASKTNPTKQEQIVLDGNSSFYEGAQIESYSFDFGDGNSTGWVSNPYVFYSYPNSGSYGAKLKVRGDNGKESNWSSVSLYVASGWPNASLEASPLTVQTLEIVNFSVNQSTDSDGTILGYHFDYGDGATSGWIMSSYASHSYSDNGTYSARLKVLDNDWHESNWTEPLNITVLNRAPVPLFWYSSDQINQGELVTFDGSRSLDPDGWVEFYDFDFGDGTDSGWITSSTTRHTYPEEGIYDITLKVRDDDGAVSMWSQVVQLLVQRHLPLAHLNTTTEEVFVGEEVYLSGQFSMGFDGHISAWVFDFGEGTSTGWIATSYATHVYSEAGEYTVTLRVRDILSGESVGVDQLTIYVTEEEEVQDVEFNWWIIIAVLLLLLWIVTLAIALRYRTRAGEEKEEAEDTNDSKIDEDG